MFWFGDLSRNDNFGLVTWVGVQILGARLQGRRERQIFGWTTGWKPHRQDCLCD